VKRDNNLEIRPNPGDGTFWLSGFMEEIPQLNVVSSIGQAMPFEFNSDQANQLRIKGSKGIYFLKIKEKDRVISRKIVIQ